MPAAYERTEARMSAKLYLGTSGWRYGIWSQDFYGGAPGRSWLAVYAGRFDAVEVNASFYRQVRPATFERWREETPPEFSFSIKAHRYLTHVKRLLFEPESLERQRDAAAALGRKLAAVLWQLPPSLRYDRPRLERFLAMLPGWPAPRHAIEFRHPSWFREDVAALLAAGGWAVCLSDAADWPLWDVATTDLVYLRLHGHEATYRSQYGESALRVWARRVTEWRNGNRDVHVYFDNTDRGAAWRDALRLRELLTE